MMLAMTAVQWLTIVARALGQYDLPIPREQDAQVRIITRNVETFGQEWSLLRRIITVGVFERSPTTPSSNWTIFANGLVIC